MVVVVLLVDSEDILHVEADDKDTDDDVPTSQAPNPPFVNGADGDVAGDDTVTTDAVLNIDLLALAGGTGTGGTDGAHVFAFKTDAASLAALATAASLS